MNTSDAYNTANNSFSHEELQTLQNIAAGDGHTYNILFQKFLPKLVYYLEPLTAGTGIDHQDIIQDIFLTIWEKKETLTAIKSFEQYLFRMAKNRFLDLLRKEDSVQQLYKRYGQIKGNESAPMPEEQYLFGQYHERAQEAIRQMSPKLQTVFVMSTQEDLSLDEISSALELPKETVKKRLWLAGNFIRDYLRKHADWAVVFVGVFKEYLGK